MGTPFADFQNEVYLKGLFGELPTLPFGWRETQAAAEAVMTPQAVGYVSGSAGGEETARANREAFDRWRLVPRMLRGIPAQRDLSTSVLGLPLPAPVLLGPVGVPAASAVTLSLLQFAATFAASLLGAGFYLGGAYPRLESSLPNDRNSEGRSDVEAVRSNSDQGRAGQSAKAA